MKSGRIVGGALGVRLISHRWHVRKVAAVVQRIVVWISGIQGAMFFFSRTEALAMGGFDETFLIAEDSTFAISMQAHARKIEKAFILFRKVQVGTLDRKELNVKIAIKLIQKVLWTFLGSKQTREELDFWYDPKR